MKTTAYRYIGPNSAVTLLVPDAQGVLVNHDVILWHGHTVDLPSDHEVTKTLAHQNWLEPISPAQVTDSMPQADQAASAAQASKPTATAKAK